MYIKPISELEIPDNLSDILEEEGYWEDLTFEPILITIEPTEFKGEEKISYQLSFETLEGYFEEIDGDEWETIIRKYIKERDADLESVIHGDSESSTCVLWVDQEENFMKLVEYVIELLENEVEIEKLK